LRFQDKAASDAKPPDIMEEVNGKRPSEPFAYGIWL
jgi:hypothetical protein